MKWKIIILIVVIIAILVLSYFLFIKKPAGSTVVQSAGSTSSTTVLGAILGGGTSAVAHTTASGAGVGTGVGVGTSGVVASTTPLVGQSAYASKNGVLVFNDSGTVRKTINKGDWAGEVTSNVGAVTYLTFTDGGKGRVLTSDVRS